MHRVADPEHVPARLLHRLHEGGQVLPHLARAHADHQRDAAGGVVRVDRVEQRDELVRGALVADLDPDRVLDAADELEVATVELPGPLAHPDHVGGTVVVLVGDRVLAGQRLLVPEQKALVRHIELRLGEGVRGGVHPDGAHEAERLLHLGAQVPVLAARRTAGHELEVPRVEPLQVGVSALGEGPQDVQGLGALVVGLDREPGVRGARLEREVLRVHVVALVRGVRHLLAVHHFGLHRRAPRLGELPRHAPDLDHRLARPVGDDQSHLEDHSHGISHVVR
mmetsp:Transcript_68252/g.154409  ORF Transcript_68252/g.154409 Transcript_68252/m.154409 type:complete len:281 (-) Transcript_68252:422-1264(-)